MLFGLLVSTDIFTNSKIKMTEVTLKTDFCFSPPVFKFENTKGLSDEDLKKLKEEIKESANKLCGEVSL